MSAAPGPARPVNGTALDVPELKDVLEYEKILKLRDQIFAGVHPRLKVPPSAIRKVSPRSVQTPPLPPPAVKEVSTGPQVPQTNGISQHNANSARANSQLSTSPVATRAPLQKISSSELDPIFLTKSDTLKNAEVRLKRERIERALRDEAEQKKKSVSQDDSPDFDVSEVLAKALERVKPVALSDTNGNATASDSFDENSLYSSRAPDSTPEGPRYRRSSSPRDPQLQPMDIDDYDTDMRAERNHGPTRQYRHENRNIIDLLQDDSPPKQDPQGHHPSRARKSSIRYVSPNDSGEEPEYSPPEPDQPSVVNRDTHAGYLGQGPSQRKESNGRPHNPPQRNGSPMSDMRIVRNHITSPAAPQPARVSPLAVAKAPPIPQSHYPQQGYNKNQRPNYGHESVRTSPEPEISHQGTRKRRRNQDKNNKGQNGFNKQGPTPRKKARPNNQRVQDSPEPYIKPEPVSPQPFSSAPLAPPKVRQIVDRPAVVDVSSPREVRYVQYPETREYEVPRQYVSAPESASHLQTQYSCSRPETRRPVREEQDLRRVASYNARHPVMHQEYVEPLSSAHTRSVRAQSYAIVDRPPPQQPQYYEGEIPTYSSRQIIRTARSPSPVLHERYAEMEAPPRIMAPPQPTPQRRIVMDENGNKYYETTVPPVPRVQQSMAPPSRSTRMEAYEEPVRARQPAVRAASVFEDPQSGRKYISEMPPPQPTYRRVNEEVADPYQGGGLIAPRVYERPEYEQRPTYRSASVQVLDYPPRQPRYIEEPLARGEGIVRMSSVRPIPTSYDGQSQIVQRVQSVRPDGREVSGLIDDEPRRPRGYIQAPVERAPYEYVRQPQEERYIEVDEMGRRIVVEGPRSGGPRVAQRY